MVLGLCACAVAFYGVRAMVGVRAAVLDVASLRDSAAAAARNVDTLDGRMRKVEAMLKLEGAKLVAEAQRASLPAMMRMAVVLAASAIGAATVIA